MKLGFFPYRALHYKAAQAYLDKKAEQGLALQKVYLGCIKGGSLDPVDLTTPEGLEFIQERLDLPR